MIDREHDLSITKQAEVLKAAAFIICRAPCLPPTSRSCGASISYTGVPIRRLADVERPAGCRGEQDRPPACDDADEADGDRGALSPSPHDQARAWPQGLSVSAARCSDHATEPGLGRWISPTSRWRAASSAWPLCWTGSVGGFCRSACRSPWRQHSASRRWRRRW